MSTEEAPPAPRVPIDLYELTLRLRRHQTWLDARLPDTAFPSPRLDLSHTDIRPALREARQVSAEEREAQRRTWKRFHCSAPWIDPWYPFRDQDLTDAILTDCEGLLAEHLSGADLTRCALPDPIAKFESIGAVKELSLNAGKMFLTTLVACLFVLLTTQTTPDLALLTNSGTAELPALGIKISVPIASFFTIAPLILLTLSITTHLYLQRLWELMATLPAVFPDGMTVDNKTYPWLVNDLVRTGFPLLRRRPVPLSWMQVWAFGLIAYGTVPLFLYVVFLRCLMRHDDLLSVWQSVMLTLSVGWAFLVWHLNRVTLRRDEASRVAFVGWWRRFTPWKQAYRPTWRQVAFLLPAAVLSLGTLAWTRELKDYAQTGTPLTLSVAQRSQLTRLMNGGGEYDSWRSSLQRIDDALNKESDHGTSDYHAAWEGRNRLAALIEAVSIPRSNIPLNRFPTPTFEARPFPNPLEAPLDIRITHGRFWGDVVNRLRPGFQGRSSARIDLKDIAEARPAVRLFAGLPPLLPAQMEADTTTLTDKWKDLPEFPLPKPPPEHQPQKPYPNKPASQQRPYEEILLEFAQRGGYRVSQVKRQEFQTAIENQLRPIVKGSPFSNSSRNPNLRFLQARRAFLVSANLTGADLTFADLSEADLRNVTFSRTDQQTIINLSFAILLQSNLTGTYLRRATLTGADLSDATLTGADLREAVLIGADLSFAHLTGADLSSADLTGADLNSADLTGADLREAVLIGAEISADYSTRGPILTGADLSDAMLIGANLNGATLKGADLRGTDFQEASGLDYANFDGCIVRIKESKSQRATVWPNGLLPPRWKLAPIPWERIEMLAPNDPNERKEIAESCRMLVRVY